MHQKGLTSAESRLVVLPFAAPADDLGWVQCVHCHRSLDLHQPDAQVPDRLLGICEVCSLWFLVELATEVSKVILYQMPDGPSLRGSL